jgi:hypothetical protein
MSRPVGSKNKIGTQVKENIVSVFTRLGGTAAMADWAKANTTEFYRMYCRLAPTDVSVDITENVVERMTEAEIDAKIARLDQILSGGAAVAASGAEAADTGDSEPSSVH